MDTEVARTLAELERKLGDLERALSGAARQEPTGGLAGGARLVDERLEGLDSAVPATGPGPAPTTPPPFSEQRSDESIELAELARFRDRLEQTMRDLLADYERVIRLRGASEAWSPADRT